MENLVCQAPYIFRKSYYCSVPLLLACPRMCSPEQGQNSCFVIIILAENRHLTRSALCFTGVPATCLSSMDTNRPEMAFWWKLGEAIVAVNG